MSSKRKKNEARKAKEEGTEREKKFCFLRIPELHKLLVLHLDQRAAKCTTCKQLCGKKKKERD